MKTLSIIIPVFNEEKRLTKTFKALSKGFNFNGVKLEKIIFVDDGSVDKTIKKIKNQKLKLENSTETKVEIYSYKPNKGKGYAIKVGMLVSKSDYTLFFDADIPTPISEFKKFLPFIEKGVPVIIGTRKNGEPTVVVPQPFYRQVLGRGFTLLSNLLLNTWVTDFTCGFKVFSKDAKEAIFNRSFVNGWAYDAEILFLAQKLGFEVAEKAVLWSDDHQSKVRLIKDLPQSIIDLIKIRIYHSQFTLPLSKNPVFAIQVS